jgi:hypothetical protein
MKNTEIDKQRFVHRFKNGTTVELTYDPASYQAGQMAAVAIQWSKKPTQRMLPEYLRWKHGIMDRLATIVDGRLMDIIQTKPHLCEVWVHERGKAGIKISETAWPLTRE